MIILFFILIKFAVTNVETGHRLFLLGSIIFLASFTPVGIAAVRGQRESGDYAQRRGVAMFLVVVCI